jgi:hypothetical protein
MKNRFKPNDQIVQYRNNEVIRKGTVVKGPMRLDKVDHYHVTWHWEDERHGTPEQFRRDVDLICDLISTKYRYDIA